MSYKPEDRPLPEDLLEDPWFAPVAAAAAEPQPKELEERGVVLAPVAQASAPDDATAATPSGAASARGV